MRDVGSARKDPDEVDLARGFSDFWRRRRLSLLNSDYNVLQTNGIYMVGIWLSAPISIQVNSVPSDYPYRHQSPEQPLTGRPPPFKIHIRFPPHHHEPYRIQEINNLMESRILCRFWASTVTCVRILRSAGWYRRESRASRTVKATFWLACHLIPQKNCKRMT
jgi:hypothetical protein